MAYQNPSKENWTGRVSNRELYLHEKINLCPILSLQKAKEKTVALLGYSSDEGVKRNQGRVGAKDGPSAIRLQLGKMPNHLSDKEHVIDVGDVSCENEDMEASQKLLTEKVTLLLEKNTFPILLGGGHDIAYGHYNGVKNYLESKKPASKIGIINFDAHFDLRSNESGNNSGTPFFQIAEENKDFHYLCLGIREDANDAQLFKTADKLNVEYILRDLFSIDHLDAIQAQLKDFIKKVDKLYITIDLDGFSSAFAPGVSAASPMGYSPDIVVTSLQKIISSKKVISIDIAEMNPKYDRDNQTAKLAASLIHEIVHSNF